MGKTRLPLLVGVLLALLVLVFVWWWSTRPSAPESLDELARQSLQAASPEKQEQAAFKLQARAASSPKTGPRNAAQPHLCRVLRDSKTPGVRIACMQGLASIWDYDCVPTMLDLLDDQSPLVRSAAATAVFKLTGSRSSFNPYDPPEKRKEGVAKYRQNWKDFVARKLEAWKQRLEKKDKNEPGSSI